jgi:PII-like signaling protein
VSEAGSCDALVLSAYFGERSRAGNRLLSDALLDLYEQRGVRMSVLLRGAQGFGAKHRLRTDRLLTLSEDLPVVAVAVDRRERVQSLSDEVAQLMRHGLVTVESAHMPPPTGDCVRSTSAPHIADALKLTVYVGRHERVERRPAFVAVCQLLHERGVVGATVLLGVDGTNAGHRRRARFFARNEQVPTMVLAVGQGRRLSDSARELQRLLPDALLTVEQVRVCKRDGELLQAPHNAADAQANGAHAWQKLTVVTSEAALYDGRRAVHIELVRRLRETRIAGATSLRGVWGFHGEHPPHGDRLLSFRRHVPVVTIAIDRPERIAFAFELADELTRERGLVTSELVPANIASRCGCSSVG